MNSKYLEKLIQEEYQKIILEQQTEKPGTGGLNSQLCKDEWRQSDREYFRKHYSYGAEDYFINPAYLNGNPPKCVLTIKLANTFTTVFNNAAAEKPFTAGTFLYGQEIKFWGNGKAEAYLNVGGLDNKEVELKWMVSDDKKGVELWSDNMHIGNLAHGANSTLYIPKEKQVTGNWTDTLQSIGDWLGLIPFYGDVIDIVNAIGYAVKKKWLDAGLSMIAVIPIAGSIFKLGLMNAIKIGKVNAKLANTAVKRILMGQPGATKTFWKLIWDSGAVQKAAAVKKIPVDAVFKLALANIDEAIAISKKGLNKSKNLNFPEHVTEYASALVKFFEDSKLSIKGLQELAQAGGKQILKWAPEFKTANTLEKTVKQVLASPSKLLQKGLRISIGVGTGGISEITRLLLKRVFKFDGASLEELSKGYKAVVNAKIKQAPQYISAIMRAMPFDELLKVGDSVRETREFLQNIGRKILKDKGFNTAQINSALSSNEQLMKVIADPKNADSPIMRTFIAKYSDKILEEASKGQNLAYNLFYNNKQWQAEQFFRRSSDFKLLLQNSDFKAAFKKLSKEYFQWKNLVLNSKNSDIYLNQFSDLLDRTGFGSSEYEKSRPDSILLALLMASIDIGTGKEWGTTSKEWKTNLLDKDSVIVHGSAEIQNFITWVKRQSGGSQNPAVRLLINVLDLIPEISATQSNKVGLEFPNFNIDPSALPFKKPEQNKAWVQKTWNDKIPDEFKSTFQVQYDQLIDFLNKQIEKENDRFNQMQQNVMPASDNTRIRN